MIKDKTKRVAQIGLLAAVLLMMFLFGYREGRISAQQSRVEEIYRLLMPPPSPIVIPPSPTRTEMYRDGVTDDEVANYLLKGIASQATSANITIRMAQGHTEGNLSITFGSGR